MHDALAEIQAKGSRPGGSLLARFASKASMAQKAEQCLTPASAGVNEKWSDVQQKPALVRSLDSFPNLLIFHRQSRYLKKNTV